MIMNVDKDIINDAQQLIESEKFSQFLLNNTTDFAVATFLLSACFNAVDDARAKLEGQD